MSCPACGGRLQVPEPPRSHAHWLGIDFGTSFSSMAWFNPRTHTAEVLYNAEGEDKTPSVVYFGGQETLVGKHAEGMLIYPEERPRIVIAAKRELARNRVWQAGGRTVTPVDVATEVLTKLKRDAENGHFYGAVSRAVITHPAVFDTIEKDRLREAAGCAGFERVELLEEPLAAAMAFAETGVRVGRTVFVYDLGGGTLDLALLVRDPAAGGFRLALEPRGARIGGEDFDRAMYDYFDATMRRQRGRPIAPDGCDLEFLRDCRRYKENLSASKQPRPLSLLRHGLPRTEFSLSWATFEGLIGKDVEQTVRLTQALRDEARAAGHGAESLLLIGGSSRMPFIQQRLQEALQLAPQEWQKRDLAVALGAAYHAHRLTRTPSVSVPAPPPRSRPGGDTAQQVPDDHAPTGVSVPYRAGVILILGIVSIVVGVLVPFAGMAAGAVALILGHHDLTAKRNRQMDPGGADVTRVGWLCGLVGICLSVVCCFGYALLLINSSPPP
jgi:molecular chaperone DnaK (HSP70)